MYHLVNFLRQNTSAVYYDKESKEYYNKVDIINERD